MRIFSLICLTGFLFSVSLAFSQPLITEERKGLERYEEDPLAVRGMSSIFETYPDSSLVDFSFLLDAPAGKQGFVKAEPDGHFYFSDTGKRVRFWGMTVAADHVDIEKEKIKMVVDVLARGGCNLLRLHELDNRGAEKYNLVRRSLIDESFPNDSDSRHFDPEYRDRVDYWIACAKEKGMYVYLVLRGYRTFRENDGVPKANKLDRAARPYSMFNGRMIELQKEYAREWLFDHINPYTGIPNGLDPAVAMIEIENEDSIFFERTPWRDFIEPYKTGFQTRWNKWLRKEYSSTKNLLLAWKTDSIPEPLLSSENLEEGSIELPDMQIPEIEDLKAIKDPLRAPSRCSDGVRFAAELQRSYFAEMRNYLHSLGEKAPLTAVVYTPYLVDTWTVAQELDFVAQNNYMDHPGYAKGQQWMGKQSFQNKNHLKETGLWGLAPQMAVYKWEGKPWVSREWTVCWPNEYRSASFLDMAAQARLQDDDGLIHFCYNTWGDQEKLSPFGCQADPLRWGLNGYAAFLFLSDTLEPNSQKASVGYTKEDLFTWASYQTDLLNLSWTHLYQNSFVENSTVEGMIPSGRSTGEPVSLNEPIEFPTFINGVCRNPEEGYLTLDTEFFKAIAGELKPEKTYEAGELKIKTNSPVCSVAALSLDRKPFEASGKIAIKMVTKGINRNQKLVKAEDSYVLEDSGVFQVQTLGEKSEVPTQIAIGSRVVLELFVENGMIEAVIDFGKKEIFLTCDTPNAQISISPEIFGEVEPGKLKLQKFFYEVSPPKPEPEEYTFKYPGFSKYVKLFVD